MRSSRLTLTLLNKIIETCFKSLSTCAKAPSQNLSKVPSITNANSSNCSLAYRKPKMKIFKVKLS